MATKKASVKVGNKVATKASSTLIKTPIQPLYGRPILDAVQRGDIAEMKSVKAPAQKHIKEVQAALAKLEAKLSK